MKLRILTTIIISLSFFAFADQPNFRKGIFLTHSTGLAIWGPNGSSTSVPDEIVKYNALHKFSPDSSFNVVREDFPLTPWENEWSRWHNIFDGKDTDAYIEPFFSNYEILIVKSCFPSSALDDRGSSADTLNPTTKSIYNYKWHWRSIIRKMALHPDNFFVIWTNAPLVAGQTNDNSALLSDSFCHWAKDTLAKGLDSEFGTFPVNVYVFDFFHKLAGTDGKLQLKYAVSNSDSHPNSDATALVAPQLVDEVFNSAIAYESKVSGIAENNAISIIEYSLNQNYPNPFNPSTKIKFSIPKGSHILLSVYNTMGQEVAKLISKDMNAGVYTTEWNASGFSSGVYYYRIVADNFIETKKLLLLK